MHERRPEPAPDEDPVPPENGDDEGADEAPPDKPA